MTDDWRDRCIEAIEAMAAAEKAYRDESARYVSVRWAAGDEPVPDPEPVTRKALKTLRRLRKEAEAAQQNYEQVRDSLQ